MWRMMRPRCSAPRLLRVVLWLAAGAGFAAVASTSGSHHPWPNWRGPQGNGSVATGDYPEQWQSDRPAWKVELPGKGSSTPIVARDRIFLTAPDDGRDAVLAFDLNGQRQWLTRLGAESAPKHRTLGSSCNASPVTDGKSLFVYFKSGTLASLDLDGKIRWQINLVETFGKDQLFWDQGASPVVSGSQVIFARLHGGDSWVAGFDQATGELRWRRERDYEAPTENDNGYTTPVLFRHGNRDAFLLWGADVLTAHDLADGALLWSCHAFNPQGRSYWPAIASPVVTGDLVVVPVGRDDRPGQANLHGIRLGGQGDVTGTHRAWKREDVGVFVTTPAEHRGRVYLLRHRGEVVCLDPATGATVWQEALPKGSAPFYASPVIANGVLYAAREDGVVFTARVGDRFELLGEHPMGERIVATPVPVNNRLLLRGDRHLFCVAGQ